MSSQSSINGYRLAMLVYPAAAAVDWQWCMVVRLDGPPPGIVKSQATNTKI